MYFKMVFTMKKVTFLVKTKYFRTGSPNSGLVTYIENNTTCLKIILLTRILHCKKCCHCPDLNSQPWDYESRSQPSRPWNSMGLIQLIPVE